MTAAKAAPRRKTAKKAAPSQSVTAEVVGEGTAKSEESPAAPAAGDSLFVALYPKGTELWWYTAKDGTRIPFPKYSTITPPTRQFWRRLYGLDEMFQAFEWMRWAGIPEAVQTLTDHLDDGEYQVMFEGWFADADLTAGE